jgi:hypothetical protein
MTDRLEERYEDVLQNIEFAIVSVYGEHPDLADSNVDRVLDGLIRTYTAEMNQRRGPTLVLSELEQTLLARVRSMCEWRLGRDDGPQTQAGAKPFTPEPKTPDEIAACLKRIRKSVKRWSAQGGRQGYLRFVSQYII